MVTVSDELKEAFLAGTQKYITLSFSDGTTLTDDNVLSESMSISQILSSGTQFYYGTFGAAEFTIQIFNDSISRKGLSCTISLTAYAEDDDEQETPYTMNLGTYIINTDTVSDDRNKRTLVGYDSLYAVINSDYATWYQNLTFPMTVKEFRDAFFEEIGITQEDTTLINDSVELDATIFPSTLTGSTILNAFLEINACCGFIDYTGTFRYVGSWNASYGLYPSDELYPDDELYPADKENVAFFGGADSDVADEPVLDSFVYEDYYYMEVSGCTVIDDDDDTGNLIGTDTNVYAIKGNFLLYGCDSATRTTVATNFLESATDFFFKPLKFKVRSHPWIELGDFIGASNGSVAFYMPVLTRTIDGITALYDTYTAKGTEYYSDTNGNTISDSVKQLKSRNMKITADVDEISTCLSGILDEGNTVTSEIAQQIDNITIRVSDGTNEQTLKISTEDIVLTGLVRVSNGEAETYINGDYIKTGTILAYDSETSGTYSTDLTTSSTTITLDLNTVCGVTEKLYGVPKVTVKDSNGDETSNVNITNSVYTNPEDSSTTGGTLTLTFTCTADDTYTFYVGGYWFEADATDGKLSWSMENSAMSSDGYLTIRNAAIVGEDYYFVFNAEEGTLSWELPNSKMTENGFMELVGAKLGDEVDDTEGFGFFNNVMASSPTFTYDSTGKVTAMSTSSSAIKIYGSSGNIVTEGTIKAYGIIYGYDTIRAQGGLYVPNNQSIDFYSDLNMHGFNIILDNTGNVELDTMAWTYNSTTYYCLSVPSLYTTGGIRSDFIYNASDAWFNGKLYANGGLHVPNNQSIDFYSDLNMNYFSIACGTDADTVLKAYSISVPQNDGTTDSVYGIGSTGGLYATGVLMAGGNAYSNGGFLLVRNTYNGSIESGTYAWVYSMSLILSTPYLEVTTSSGAYGITVWSSDERLKKNISDTDVDALSVVNSIQHRQFDWKSNDKHVDIGYVAQELMEIAPDAVFAVSQSVEDDNADVKYQIDVRGIVPLLSRAIQQLSAKVDELEERISVLENG